METNALPDIIQAVGWIFSSSWQLLTGIKVPGTGVSFATLFIALLLADIALRLLFMVLGVSLGSRDLDRAESSGLLKRKDDK